MAVTISKNYIDEILSAAGYPLITLDDIALSIPQIKDIILEPVIREFYKWFPIAEETTYDIAEQFAIDFPDIDVFGVLDARINTMRAHAYTTGNPFIDNQFIAVSRGGRYGTRYNYDMKLADLDSLMERRALIDFSKSLRIRVNETTRQLTGYSNLHGGILSVTWAKKSSNFDIIPYNRINEVIKLAQAQLLRYLGMLRNQAAGASLPDSIDGSEFIERANNLEEEIITKWQEFPKVVLLRG